MRSATLSSNCRRCCYGLAVSIFRGGERTTVKSDHGPLNAARAAATAASTSFSPAISSSTPINLPSHVKNLRSETSSPVTGETTFNFSFEEDVMYYRTSTPANQLGKNTSLLMKFLVGISVILAGLSNFFNGLGCQWGLEGTVSFCGMQRLFVFSLES